MSGAVEGNDVRKILAQFDAPAFVRRAKGVELAEEFLHAHCSRQREEWLEMRRGTLRIYHQFPVGLIAFALGLVLGLWSAGGM